VSPENVYQEFSLENVLDDVWKTDSQSLICERLIISANFLRHAQVKCVLIRVLFFLPSHFVTIYEYVIVLTHNIPSTCLVTNHKYLIPHIRSQQYLNMVRSTYDWY